MQLDHPVVFLLVTTFPFPALIVRYVTRRFIYDYAPEIAKVYQHQTVLDQEDVHMEIWDTAGHFQVGTHRQLDLYRGFWIFGLLG